jgi:hypothetical protein
MADDSASRRPAQDLGGVTPFFTLTLLNQLCTDGNLPTIGQLQLLESQGQHWHCANRLTARYHFSDVPLTRTPVGATRWFAIM